MAGHSKWANIKHRKSRADEQKGKIFTKLARELTVAAREGGGDPEANVCLRMAIQKARENNMPNENIQRAIQKGTGGLEGQSYESATCEGYGPGGIAVLVDALTDNRNRTVAEIRNIFSKHGGNLGEAGCVSWMFERKGYISIPAKDFPAGEEELMNEAIEAGAEDFRGEEGCYEIITDPADFEAVRQALKEKDWPVNRADLTMLPHSLVRIEDPEKASQLLRLLEVLEDNDDVQNVYANFDIPEEFFSRVE